MRSGRGSSSFLEVFLEDRVDLSGKVHFSHKMTVPPGLPSRGGHYLRSLSQRVLMKPHHLRRMGPGVSVPAVDPRPRCTCVFGPIKV
jgi:hypothetical protein